MGVLREHVPVDTFGGYRLRSGLAALAFGSILLLAGCGSHSSAGPVSTRSPGVAPPGSGSLETHPLTRCVVPLPLSARAALRAQWARQQPGTVAPFTSIAMGDWDVAEQRTGSFAGVSLVNLKTGAVRKVEEFPDAQFQALGGFDGRFAVWKEFHSPSDLDDFSVKLWDESSGRVTTVGGAHRDPSSGKFYPSPWTEPTMGGGYAAWVEGTAFDGQGRLVVLNLRTGTERAFSTAHPGGAMVAYRGDLVWAESTKPGALTRVFAKSLASGKSEPPPPTLAGQRGPNSIATDGTALAWVGSDQRSIYYAEDGGERPRLLVRLHVGGFNPPTVVHGPVVMSTFSDGVLAVTPTGTRTTVVHGGGGVTATGDRFLVRQNTPSKESAGSEPGLAELTRSTLNLPTCPATK